MDIVITGRNFDLDNDIKIYVHKRLEKLEKMYRRIYKCEVILEEEKLRKNVEVILYLKRNRVVAKETSPDLYASIDNATDKIKKQLRRLHGKVSSKRRKAVMNRIISPVSMFRSSGDIELPKSDSEIVKSDNFAERAMMPEEARIELDISGNDFIMFKNSETGDPNVLYRKNDGTMGLIEPPM